MILCMKYYRLLICYMLQKIQESCVEFLIKKNSKTTCFQNLKLAEKYELQELESVSENFILNNFVALSTQEDFKEMSMEQLCKYLKDDRLRGKEIEIFRAAKGWLDDRQDQDQDNMDVLKMINYKAIPLDMLADEVLQDDLVKCEKKYFEMVLNAVKYHSNVFSQPLDMSSTSRGEKAIVMIYANGHVDGSAYKAQGNTHFRTYEMLDMQNTEGVVKSKIIELKCKFAHSSLSMVELNNFLYLFGTDNDSFASLAKRFDATIGIWVDLAPVPKCGTAGSTANYISQSIILVGGILISDRLTENIKDASKLTDTTLSYSVRNNEWKMASSCPAKIVYHSSCSHQGLVYVAGGYIASVNNNSPVLLSSKLYAYDPAADLWLSKTDMNQGRAEATLDAVDGNLFLIGGGDYYLAGHHVPSIEMYDVLENQWTMVEKEPGFPYDSVASLVDGGNIYLLGGYNYKTKSSASTSVFDSNTRKITTKQQNLGCSPLRHVCAVVKMQNIEAS